MRLHLILHLDEGMLFKRLQPVDRAHYNSHEGMMRLPTTRQSLRDRVIRWIEGSDPSRSVFWLHGMAESGKTAIANTIVHTVRYRFIPMSSFMCRRDDPKLSDTKKIFPALASRFARQYSTFCESVLKLLDGHDDLDALNGNFDKQFDLLFKNPLAETADPL